MKAPDRPMGMKVCTPLRGLLAMAMAIGLLTSLMGQEPQESLTDKFPNMSAKERSRIAAQENVDAMRDTAYQRVMRSAEQFFKTGRYQEALTNYEQARSMRPYNVHPKVKIEDLRALIAGRKSADGAPRSGTTPPPPGGAQPRAAIRPPAPLPSTNPVPAEGDGQATSTTRTRSTREAVELQYKEGRAHVIERSLSVDGRVVVYKRVLHECGQVFHFQDGVPIDERVWKARFPR